MEFTLSYQCFQAQAICTKWQETNLRRRWSRMLHSLLMRQWNTTRRSALHELASARSHGCGKGGASVEDVIPSELFDNGNANSWGETPAEFTNRGLNADEEAVVAAQLGLDVATYRMLRQLEEREILPEDYDLLGRLDEVVKPATLSLEELNRFPTKVHSESRESLANSTCSLQPAFGLEFWRLPMPVLPEDVKTECNRWGSDFWKIPLPVSDDDGSTTASSNEDSSFVCGVCLLDCEEGDELRCLPCGHSFHRECIDHWLLNSSCACPIDKRDVREL
jgi:hypothetical protein